MMKKSANVDIRNLFQKFGGDTGNYQEIQQGYVSDKAQKSWPIVNAIEKAHAVAPTLRVSANRRASPVVDKPAQPDRKAEGTRSLSGLFAKPPTSDSASPLFAALNLAVKSEKSHADSVVTAVPARGLLNNTVNAPPVTHQAQSAHRAENDPLSVVFSRLLNPQDAENQQKHDLRSLFGYLNK
jgi:hypothetical protein